MASSWAVRPLTPLPQATDKWPGWEKKKGATIFTTLPSFCSGSCPAGATGPTASSRGRGPRQGQGPRRGGPPHLSPSRPPPPLWGPLGSTGSRVEAPCPAVNFGLGSCRRERLALALSEQQAPATAPSWEEVRRLVPGREAHWTQAAVAREKDSATATPGKSLLLRGRPGRLESPDPVQTTRDRAQAGRDEAGLAPGFGDPRSRHFPAAPPLRPSHQPCSAPSEPSGGRGGKAKQDPTELRSCPAPRKPKHIPG